MPPNSELHNLCSEESYMWPKIHRKCINHTDCKCLFDIYQEQQLYYKEITEACVGSCESRRAVSSLLSFWNLAYFVDCLYLKVLP